MENVSFWFELIGHKVLACQNQRFVNRMKFEPIAVINDKLDLSLLYLSPKQIMLNEPKPKFIMKLQENLILPAWLKFNYVYLTLSVVKLELSV